MIERLRNFHFFAGWDIVDGGRWRESATVKEFLRAEEKRGHLRSLTDASGPPNQSPSDLCQQRPGCANHIRSRKCHTYLSAILLSY